ncbi:MAG: nucleotidyl transferase AbiEii/AbiGii toxin family protein [Natronosporangium sp.]
MDMPDFHRQVLDAALDLCRTHRLVLVGGYAMIAHGLVERPSQDLDLATFSATPLEDVIDSLAADFRRRGFEVQQIRGTPLLGRLLVTDPTTGQACAVDVMKKPLQRPPTMIDIYPVASLDDLVGMKVAALHGRSEPRDLIDVASVTEHYSFIELERLGSLFDEELTGEGMVLRLEVGLAFPDDVFREYGLDEAMIRRLRRFLLTWCEDLSMRLAEARALAGDDQA